MLLFVAGQAGNLDHCQLRPDVALYLPQQALQARPCPRRQLPTLRTHRLRVMELRHDSLHTLLLLAQVHNLLPYRLCILHICNGSHDWLRKKQKDDSLPLLVFKNDLGYRV